MSVSRSRWRFRKGGELVVEVVDRHEGKFADFGGYEGGPAGDAVADHGAFGLGRADDEEQDQ